MNLRTSKLILGKLLSISFNPSNLRLRSPIPVPVVVIVSHNTHYNNFQNDTVSLFQWGLGLDISRQNKNSESSS